MRGFVPRCRRGVKRVASLWVTREASYVLLNAFIYLSYHLFVFVCPKMYIQLCETNIEGKEWTFGSVIGRGPVVE